MAQISRTTSYGEKTVRRFSLELSEAEVKALLKALDGGGWSSEVDEVVSELDKLL